MTFRWTSQVICSSLVLVANSVMGAQEAEL